MIAYLCGAKADMLVAHDYFEFLMETEERRGGEGGGGDEMVDVSGGGEGSMAMKITVKKDTLRSILINKQIIINKVE